MTFSSALWFCMWLVFHVMCPLLFPTTMLLCLELQKKPVEHHAREILVIVYLLNDCFPLEFRVKVTQAILSSNVSGFEHFVLWGGLSCGIKFTNCQKAWKRRMLFFFFYFSKPVYPDQNSGNIQKITVTLLQFYICVEMWSGCSRFFFFWCCFIWLC